MNNKSRILLLILTFLFIATAVLIRYSISDKELLNLETQNLTELIHKKEQSINEALENPLILRTFNNSERYPLQLKEISKKYENENIFFYIYKDNHPIFWSSNLYVQENIAHITEGNSIIKAENFLFISQVKKLSPTMTVLALIPLQRNFNLSYEPTNNYHFKELLSENNLEVANFKDSDNIRNIYNNKSKYLFSVKLTDQKHKGSYVFIEILFIISGVICFLIFLTNFCYRLAEDGHVIISVFILTGILFLIRFIDLESHWLDQYSNLEIFSAKNYAYNSFSPNLWSYLINSIFISWTMAYLVAIQKFIKIPKRVVTSHKLGIAVYYLLLTILYFFLNYTFDRLSTLITHTFVWHEEFIQILYTNKYSFIHIIIFAFNILSITLVIDFVINAGKWINEKLIININIQLIVLIQFLLFSALTQNLNLTNILFGVLIMIRSYEYSKQKIQKISNGLLTIITLAFISTIKYAEASKINQEEKMKIMLTNLESDEDIEANTLFSQMERSILNDQQLKNIIQIALKNSSPEIINEYIKKKYFIGHLSVYNVSGYSFVDGMPLKEYNRDVLNEYREKVISHSTKVYQTNNFYKLKSEYGLYDYFTIINLNIDKNDFTLILNAKRNTNDITPVIPFHSQQYTVKDNSVKTSLNNNFAIYKDGLLVTQHGTYTYPNNDFTREKTINEFIVLNDLDGFYHIMLKPDVHTTLVISKQYQSYWQFVTVACIAFLLLYLITRIANFFVVFTPLIVRKDFRARIFNYQWRFLFSKIGYGTRIQTLYIVSVLIAITLTGLVSYFSIKIQSKKTAEEQRISYLTGVVSNLEELIKKDSNQNDILRLYKTMESISDVLITDFNLYDKSGKLFYTTQPTVYDHKLLSSYINPNAFIDLNVLKKNETERTENILDFNYESTYAAIKNDNLKTVAYISVPYFNSKELEDENTNILLKTMLNIYTIITIVSAFTAIFISNKITEPLQIIRKKLSQINLSGKSNEPLYWENNDEIGVLIKEYNYMLVKLEENNTQLRNAERESTWREMAKQVAHEIKNPLTPMKLGIQQLTRSFNEDDPRLKERFAKVSTSFIEQIDALSHIASEFSAFAKLPDTKLEPINIIEKINKCIDVYRNTLNTQITFVNNTELDPLMVLGDKGQLLRTFNNLIKNSIEASSGKKKIDVNLAIDILQENWIRVTIKDNGYGISDEILPNLFKPNFTTKSSGTGLGLAFVKQTVTGMGGEISYVTDSRKGTSFFLDIPLLQD